MPTSTAIILDNPANTILIKKTNQYNQKINEAKDNAWNVDKEKITNNDIKAGQNMMITTPGGNILTWNFIDDADRAKRYFEFTDLKRWGWTIKVPYSEDNLKAFRELSTKQATWKYWRDWYEIFKPDPQIKLYDWDKQITLDQYIDNKKLKLQENFDKYLNTFKAYKQADAKTQKKLEPIMKQALNDYYNLKINLYSKVD